MKKIFTNCLIFLIGFNLKMFGQVKHNSTQSRKMDIDNILTMPELPDVGLRAEGWGLFRKDNVDPNASAEYARSYTYDELNRLLSTIDAHGEVNYVYDYKGERTNKYTKNSETLYFNRFYAERYNPSNRGGQSVKHIYLGNERIVTKLNSKREPTFSEEVFKQYYFHADHLGSASLITDKDGNEYQRIEFTPYGETWVERTNNTGLAYLPHKFTGKERDEETGLYYFGARYLDPVRSRWMTTDPALCDYVSGTSSGSGGIFNFVNLNLYHYGGNNPIKYVDPDGRVNIDFQTQFKIDMQNESWGANLLGNSTDTYISGSGCYLTGITMSMSNLSNSSVELKSINEMKDCFSGANLDGSKVASKFGFVFDYWTRGVQGDLGHKINELHSNSDNNSILAKVAWDKKSPDKANHWVGISGGAITDPDLGEGTYVKITGTSTNDKIGSRPSYWKEKNGSIYIPTSKIERIHVFTKENRNSNFFHKFLKGFGGNE